MSAANAAMKVLDAVRVGELPDVESITDKQKSLLVELAYDRIEDEEERERLLSAVRGQQGSCYKNCWRRPLMENLESL
jgi:hypothetical protein